MPTLLASLNDTPGDYLLGQIPAGSPFSCHGSISMGEPNEIHVFMVLHVPMNNAVESEGSIFL